MLGNVSGIVSLFVGYVTQQLSSYDEFVIVASLSICIIQSLKTFQDGDDISAMKYHKKVNIPQYPRFI
jgi:hypothetical protein